MRKYRQLAAIVLALTMLLLMAGCGGGNTGSNGEADNAGGNGQGAPAPEVIKIEIGSTATPQHSATRAATEMKQYVEEKTDGRVQITLSFGGVLGSEREMTEAVQLGNLQMGWLSDIGMASVVPEIGFVNLPYLLPTYADVDKYYFNGFLGEEVKNRLQAKGIRVLAFGENDYRDLTNSKRPITKPEDMKGLKIRVPEFPMLLSFFRQLGALPTPMAVTELMTALQQKTVDGQDNGPILTYSFGFYQAQKYMTLTNHSYSGAAFVVSEKFWQTLPPDVQQVLQEAAAIYGQKQVEMNRADVAGFLDKIKAANVEVSEMSPEGTAAMQQIAVKVWDEFAPQHGPELINRIKQEIGGVK